MVWKLTQCGLFGITFRSSTATLAGKTVSSKVLRLSHYSHYLRMAKTVRWFRWQSVNANHTKAEPRSIFVYRCRWFGAATAVADFSSFSLSRSFTYSHAQLSLWTWFRRELNRNRTSSLTIFRFVYVTMPGCVTSTNQQSDANWKNNRKIFSRTTVRTWKNFVFGVAIGFIQCFFCCCFCCCWYF